MAIWADQRAETGTLANFSRSRPVTSRSARCRALAASSDQPSHAIPADQRVRLWLKDRTDSFSLAVLLVPTFGNTRTGYLSIMPWISDESDFQHASPTDTAGLARLPGSNDA
jgi:hypothetical protein